ncbi:hypothetical protein [Lutibacter sp.]
MKNKLLFLLLLFISTIQSQNFDEKLHKLAQEVTLKLKHQKVTTIAVYPFFNIKKKQTDLSLFTSSEFNGYVANNKIKTVDRNHINQTLQEHQLNSEGLIDPTTAKKFGMLIAVDAYITGTVDVFGSIIRIKIKAINPETGEIYASVFDKLPIDYDMAQFLGITDWEEKREKAEENKSQNPNCAIENVGDYCFLNNSNNTYEVHLKKQVGGGFSSTYKRLILAAQSKMCFKNLKVGSYSYEVKRKVGMVGPATKYSTELKGDFIVKKCESRVQKIIPQNFNTILNTVEPAIIGELISVKIINPNYYPRLVIFTNKNGQVKSLQIGAKSNSSIQLVKGFYSFLSKTTFSNVVVQQTNFNLLRNKVVSLSEDHKN